MQTLNIKKLKECLELAIQMRNSYELTFTKTTEISIDSFAELCSKEINKPIDINTLKGVKANDHLIKGLSITFENHYEVWVLEETNTCRRRFVTVKELFHVLLDCPEYRNMDFQTHAIETVNDGPSVEPLPSAQSELYAEYAAMEFLLPLKHRKEIAAQYPQPEFNVIAKQYRIPQYYVERFLSKSFIEYFSVYTPAT